VDYDPLLAKLIVYGETREQAVARLRRALKEYSIGGIKTNLALFRRILQDDRFASGDVNTGFLGHLSPSRHGEEHPSEKDIAIIAAGIFSLTSRKSIVESSPAADSDGSQWKRTARQEALN
jgi:acetyl-CoA carboxylase, biotin carboxylase subunit